MSSTAATALTGSRPVLSIDDLSLEFRTRSGTVRALDHVSLSVRRGEIVGLVGESGSGKSVLCHALLGLSDRAARITGGTMHFDGIDLLAATEHELPSIFRVKTHARELDTAKAGLSKRCSHDVSSKRESASSRSESPAVRRSTTGTTTL